MAQIIIVLHIPDNLKCHMRQSPEDTGAREEGNCRQRSGSLLSLLVDGSPGGEILQLLLQFLTTLLESSHGFLHLLLALDPELPQATHQFLDDRFQRHLRGTALLMQHLPAGGLLLLLGDQLEELRIVTHELLDEAGRLVNRGIADLEQLHQAVDQLLLRSDASENVVVAGEGLQERRLVAMADAANALVRALACP